MYLADSDFDELYSFSVELRIHNQPKVLSYQPLQDLVKYNINFKNHSLPRDIVTKFFYISK